MVTIGIRLDAGKAIGLGHLMRCLSLAEAFSKYKDIRIYFLCRNKIQVKLDYEVVYLNKEYKTKEGSYDFPKIDDELDEMEDLIKKYYIDCLIVDHYGATDSYFQNIRKNVKKLVCIDDGMKREIPVDVIVNGNVYGKDAVYSGGAVLLLGGRYTLLRREFQNPFKKQIKSKVEDVYITSGGADPLRFCDTIMQSIFEEHIKIHIIAGCDFEEGYISDLEKKGAIIHKNAQMVKCMQEADLFITGAGSTLYELAVCGVPSVSFILAEDQELVGNYLWNIGTSVSGGLFSEFDGRLFLDQFKNISDDYILRKNMALTGKRTISSKGAENVVKEFMKIL